MNSSAIFEDAPNGSEKKKRKLFEDALSYDSNFLPNSLTQINGGSGGDGCGVVHPYYIPTAATPPIGNYPGACKQGGNYGHFCTHDNTFNMYKQGNNEIVQEEMNNLSTNINFDKNALINSIDVILNFVNYHNLNDTIKPEILHENLLNLRFHILSLNEEKFNQKKITEYFLKM
ncbi:conserved Plasmodium protein, unknown function [Plasmodium ovale]|uniref:Uncharacterized protein n=2 Tax=Plasmodium ovale TaxID=36330 RepID=A0A1A8VZ85_PLAOA|nr:conserved Plasmodium protein, unknown function [Plasmodium ovale curtisi]SBS96101.1 conserved Plasmodium protein, unknown function [Plasmodium ovale curtisi]SCP05304.1 conserved Plasmodium protein, unknown function [Plasmodium ovale]